MRNLIHLLLLFPGLLAAAPVLQVGKLSFPEFEPGGAMVRRLSAESASGPLETPALGKGALEFFAHGERSPEVVARLEFDEAIYERGSTVIRGAGEVRFRSEQGEVRGTGYSYDMSKGELRLDSKVEIRLPQGRVDASKAEVWLDPKADSAGNIAIRRAELSGGVVATELKDRRLAVDRVEAAHASYLAEDGLLRLPSPVDIWRDGQKGRLESESISFEIGPVLLPAKKKNPAATTGGDETAVPAP